MISKEEWDLFVERALRSQQAVRALVCNYHCPHPERCRGRCQKEVSDTPGNPTSRASEGPQEGHEG